MDIKKVCLFLFLYYYYGKIIYFFGLFWIVLEISMYDVLKLNYRDRIIKGIFNKIFDEFVYKYVYMLVLVVNEYIFKLYYL